jgi:predicted SAM-dependent methyltransferase
MDLSTATPVRLNLGAGSKVHEGWISVGLEDAHDVRCDVRTLPLADDFADEAMAIHVLEHLWRWDALDALKEWHRVLKPRGRLVIEQPELMRCCRAVLSNPDPRAGILGLFGDPFGRNELMMHKWCWTERELKTELKAAGFRKVKATLPQFHGKRTNRDMRIEAWK